MSVTDDISSQLFNKAENSIPQVFKKGTEAARGSVDIAKSAVSGTVSGIALIFKATEFTSQTIMRAVGRMQKNPKYYKNNVSITELEKNSDIRKIDTNLTKEEMKCFDKSCSKFGIKYNALVDKSNPKEPTYYVFFKGKDTAVIESAMKEAYQMFVKEQASPKVSIRAKLAFFHERVTARDREQQNLGKEKHHSHSDIQR